MKLTTEVEQFSQIQQLAYRLRKLYLEDRNLFDQVNDYLPYAIYFNKRNNLDMVFADETLLSWGGEMEKLWEFGVGYLQKISCPILFPKLIPIVKNFNEKANLSSQLKLFQRFQLRGEMSLVYTSKFLLDENTFFNFAALPEQTPLIENIFKEVFDTDQLNQQKWYQFQALTTREKQIILLLTDGLSTQEIANQLFISEFTLRTHRKNINKKLDSNKTADIVKMGLFIKMLDVI